MDKVKGEVVWKFTEHFNADLIVGAKNIGEKNQDILGKVFMGDFDPDLVNRVRRGRHPDCSTQFRLRASPPAEYPIDQKGGNFHCNCGIILSRLVQDGFLSLAARHYLPRHPEVGRPQQ